MKILNLIKSLLFIFAIVFIFFNWKISIVLFLIASVFHVIPAGPNALLSVITGLLMIGGIVYLFIDWKIGVVLIFGSLVMAKFRLWGNKINQEYYNEKNDKAKTD